MNSELKLAILCVILLGVLITIIKYNPVWAVIDYFNDKDLHSLLRKLKIFFGISIILLTIGFLLSKIPS